jgi:hypothetical protein
VRDVFDERRIASRLQVARHWSAFPELLERQRVRHGRDGLGVGLRVTRWKHLFDPGRARRARSDAGTCARSARRSTDEGEVTPSAAAMQLVRCLAGLLARAPPVSPARDAVAALRRTTVPPTTATTSARSNA